MGVGVALVPGPVMPLVLVGAADATSVELVVGAARIGDTTEETTDTTLDKSESTKGAADEDALADVVVAAAGAGESVVTGFELVAAAVEGVMTPLGTNVMVLSEDVVAGPDEPTVVGIDGVFVAGGPESITTVVLSITTVVTPVPAALFGEEMPFGSLKGLVCRFVVLESCLGRVKDLAGVVRGPVRLFHI